MYNNEKTEFLEYLELSLKSSEEEIKELSGEDRNDEANHVKVKANIFQIFKTVFLGVVNQKALDKEEVKNLFQAKTESIPANWKKSLENARAFKDTEKTMIEEIKLQTLEEIRTTFLRIWEEQYDRD
ncbi:hypothetical protein SAMN02745136_00055 [Anaerocolumna jejuensis DSM 15929]|uniref:Uncharacterized protein n=1 Tax=Anaerocolumna jejuensis DSM 15929 TaxID=1121322 RepID=A0A1M6JEY3_9FIRM|nr:hypothetical protein [Anaerocolumna jejuensis]SHJ45234.1 hypothetical protein SAMN02745136_00055 [Anaerocolumna jejuensis DSM 15929]